MNFTRREVLKVASTVPFLSLTACSTSEVSLTLSLIESAAESVVDVLLPGSAPLISLLSSVANAVDQTITELSSSDSVALKFTNISGYFSSILSTVIPAGTDSNLVSVLITDVKNFLAVINPNPDTPQLLRTRAISSSHKPWNGKLTGVDKDNLPLISKANAELRTKLLALKK